MNSNLCWMSLMAPSALQWSRTCMAMRGVVCVGIICPRKVQQRLITLQTVRWWTKIHLDHSKIRTCTTFKKDKKMDGRGLTRRLLSSHTHTHTQGITTHKFSLSLTREHSFSTASSMSSWCPILWTPKFSRSWEVNWSSSRPDKCHSDTVYCCRGASRPGHRTQKHFNTHARSSINIHTTWEWTDRKSQRVRTCSVRLEGLVASQRKGLY